ncbi:hypothetical protein DB31_6209 [Hyalangium minutum]|uniref:Uncharacterized protein n=1 Tax=Hyalangium minutum TaxID=394096 RepID=A0A085VTZ9_9BACT|nr:hypothetical protein DB31_6209 [Hyalangium minutum]
MAPCFSSDFLGFPIYGFRQRGPLAEAPGHSSSQAQGRP